MERHRDGRSRRGSSRRGSCSASRRPAVGRPEEPGTFDLLRSADLSLDQIDARSGNVLVPVRNPHALDHVAAALRATAIAMSW